MVKGRIPGLFLGSLLLFTLFLPTVGWAGCTGSSPTWASTPDRASINSCIGNARIGDTINISAGTVASGTIMSISKGITITGAGIGNTTINGAGFNIALAVDNRIEISGITFTGSGSSTGIDIGGESVHEEQIVIHDCYFSGYFQAIHIGQAHGVVYHCTFTSNEHHFYITGYPGGVISNHTPAPPWAWNSQHYLVVEDCILGPSSPKQIQVVTEYPFNYMFRHNTISEDGSYPQPFDMHGSAGTAENNIGVVIYDNTFNLSADGRVADIRGGKYNLVYNNVLTGSGDGDIALSANPGGSKKPTDTYIWGNTPGGKWSISTEDGVTLNSDYFTSQPGGFVQLTYPHPLRGIDNPPESPKNLRIMQGRN